jgi:hypothetical protein
MGKKKTLDNLDTLDIRAKKKKNFIVIIILISVVTILFVSIGSAFLSVDKKKIYEERKEIEAAKDLKVIQNPEFKENWAISIENRMESQEKKTQEVIAELSGKQDRVLDELKQIIREGNEKNQQEVLNLSENFDAKMNSLRSELMEQIQSQEEKTEQLELMLEAQKSAVSPDTGDIMIGADLLPEMPGDTLPTEDGQDKLTIIVDGKPVEKKPLTPEEIQKEKEEALEKELTDKALEAAEGAEKDLGIPEVIPEEPKEAVNHKKNIQLVDIDTSFNEGVINAQAEIEKIAAAKEQQEEMPTSYHLSTGLTQAYMITGAYAPAFQEGDSEPLPVLFEAEGEILVPNSHLSSVEKCFLLGSAKGNMNSQTANIKLVSISCLLGDADYRIEGAISGWVIGENGIPGIHGELLHKNGAWLARTFVSGFLETFANAIGGGTGSQIMFDSSQQADTGTGTAINDNLTAAGAQGVSTVFNKLGEYYLKMAEQIFPVIEVKGGRTVDILLIGGEDLSVVENDNMDIANINDHLSELSLKKESEEDTISETNAFTRSVIKSSGKGPSEDEVPDFPED